jgi:hypothetical protein
MITFQDSTVPEPCVPCCASLTSAASPTRAPSPYSTPVVSASSPRAAPTRVGLRSRDYTPDLEARLILAGAEFHRTDRGGLITFHGPGQLVGYPVVSLRELGVGMREFVARLERCLIETCRRMGVGDAKTSQHTGVWVGDKKIAAIGRLSYWNLFVRCIW